MIKDINMIGFIGLILLILAYVILITKWSRFFIPINLIAGLFLLVHSYFIQDLVFMLMNGLITLLLVIKLVKKNGI